MATVTTLGVLSCHSYHGSLNEIGKSSRERKVTAQNLVLHHRWHFIHSNKFCCLTLWPSLFLCSVFVLCGLFKKWSWRHMWHDSWHSNISVHVNPFPLLYLVIFLLPPKERTFERHSGGFFYKFCLWHVLGQWHKLQKLQCIVNIARALNKADLELNPFSNLFNLPQL